MQLLFVTLSVNLVQHEETWIKLGKNEMKRELLLSTCSAWHCTLCYYFYSVIGFPKLLGTQNSPFLSCDFPYPALSSNVSWVVGRNMLILVLFSNQLTVWGEHWNDLQIWKNTWRWLLSLKVWFLPFAGGRKEPCWTFSTKAHIRVLIALQLSLVQSPQSDLYYFLF
jgi:hypothetical protein